MKKKSLFLGGALMFAMTFSTTVFTSCHDDDKKYEEVEDPLRSQTAYYIAGTITDANGPLSGATVKSGEYSATTDAKGVYSLTVNKTGIYTLTVTAEGHDDYEATAEFTDGTANHSLMVVNVKMSTTIEFGEMQEADGSTIEAPKIENPEKENAATINIPTGGTEENTKIAAVVFEEAREANPATSTQPEASKASVNNVAIKTEPADAVAKEDIIIAIPNPSTDANLGYFDPENMEVESSEAPATRAAAKTVGFNNNNYIITIPQGEKIAGKYSPRVKFTKQAAASVADGYNEVNGKAEVIKIENRDYDALENITLTLKIKNGWDYTVSPAEALKAAGASDALATYINNYIETEEGGTNGSYEIEQKLTASVSGNHVLLYGSKRMVRVKTYTFKVVVGNQSKDVKVELKSYTGHQEEYSNNPVSQHSGGTTGGQG